MAYYKPRCFCINNEVNIYNDSYFKQPLNCCGFRNFPWVDLTIYINLF